MKIKGKAKGTIDVKRFYIDGVVITDECPACGELCELDLGEDYLSYPEIGKPESVDLYCESCDAYWTNEIILELKIKPASKK